MPRNDIDSDLRAAFAPFADGRVVHLPVDRAARKYRAVTGDEFMYMFRDEQGWWLKHRGTRNYLLSRSDGTVAVIVGKPGEEFFGGFYGDAPDVLAEVA